MARPSGSGPLASMAVPTPTPMHPDAPDVPELRHPHPAPPSRSSPCSASVTCDVLVVGGGHAGVEAALAAERLGASVVLLTKDATKIGEMSCNPAIGGLGKGQLAREVDALGGVMGLAIDRTGIQFRMLGTRKGMAVRSPRAQADRHLYREEVTRLVEAAPGVRVVEGGAAALRVAQEAHGPRVTGVRLEDGDELAARAVILATGTFLAAVMHVGEERRAGGRAGEHAAHGMSEDLGALGLDVGRLKTGTPPRLASDSIDWDDLEQQHGDALPAPFSFRTDLADFPRLPQIACHVTWTLPRTHELIAKNIGRSPVYAGRIQGTGPRYCPSVEDKVMRFPDRDRHQVVLEPEGLTTDWVYANGISTALPASVQEAFVRTLPGLGRARLLRHGYAVEYDFVQPSQLDRTFAVSHVAGLYLAGQINGTSGYEEAAAQGLLAGANAALWVGDRAPFVLGRHEAYVGVLADDLVVSRPTEPYRMFTSRAEYRLLLRQDTADRRLTPRAAAIGLAAEGTLERLREREARRIEAQALLGSVRSARHGGRVLEDVLRRPEVDWDALAAEFPELGELALEPDLARGVEADVKYAGYVQRQLNEIERMRRQEGTPIPRDLDLDALTGLRGEAREKLRRLRPATLGAAQRIAGINPPDVALLAIHIERARRAGSTAN